MKLRLLNWIAFSTMAVLSLHSSSADAIFASVKSTGMAATAISHPIDSLAGAYNPAGMPTVGDRFDLEAGWVRTHGTATIKDNAIVDLNRSYDGTKYKNAFPVIGTCQQVLLPTTVNIKKQVTIKYCLYWEHQNQVLSTFMQQHLRWWLSDGAKVIQLGYLSIITFNV
jgi:hypothetical protein